MFPEENALERLAGDVAREVVHDHDVGHTLELAGHPGVDPLHEPTHADGARPSEDGRRGRRLPPPRVLRDLSAKVVVAKRPLVGGSTDSRAYRCWKRAPAATQMPFRGQVDDPDTSRRIFPPRCACATASLMDERE